MAGIFITALVVGLTGAMMPGSLLVVTVGESAKRGWVAGPLLISGHAVLELVLVILLTTSLQSVLAQGGVAGTIGVLGGLVLAWMGYQTARSAHRGEVSLEGVKNTESAAAEAGKTSAGRYTIPMAGIVGTVSNPYWLLWWATIGAGYVIFALENGPLGVVSFYLGHITADFSWYILVAVLVATGKRFVSDRVYRGVLMTCGVFLIALAGYFIYSGWGLLFG